MSNATQAAGVQTAGVQTAGVQPGAFAPVAYPVLRDPATVAREDESAARGYAAGYAAGMRAAANDTAALRSSLQADTSAAITASSARTDAAVAILGTAVSAIRTKQDDLRTEAQETLLASALQLAEAIIGYELRTNTESTVVAALTRALTLTDPADVVAVRLNPTDLSLLPPDAAIDLGVAIVADATMQRGDARADLADGFVDAALGSALQRARAALLGGAS